MLLANPDIVLTTNVEDTHWNLLSHTHGKGDHHALVTLIAGPSHTWLSLTGSFKVTHYWEVRGPDSFVTLKLTINMDVTLPGNKVRLDETYISDTIIPRLSDCLKTSDLPIP